ncbi:MAG: helix-hairpin-helix domain-containing protein [Phycisphaerae bacterium]|nr:helix-hairpin-helix domain-containing protein [Phycisphaerae bacterium]
METARKDILNKSLRAGSALILTVVLTSLLAIIGVLFVMVSRVDKMATSAISENKSLNLAVETVVAKISQELVLDVPGMTDPNSPADPNSPPALIEEYYDYPDVNNLWLASLEPYESGGNYYWRQISQLYFASDPNLGLQAAIVPDYQDPAVIGQTVIADADGDGVGDSQWVIVPDISSSKGKPIYAAVRIIDNAAMLNANTALKLDLSDPNTPARDIGGSRQSQISFLALAGRPGLPHAVTEETDLLAARASSGRGVDPLNVRAYEESVTWRYGEPNMPYTPFDMSDELELRYRFLLNHPDIDTRLEAWGGEFRTPALTTPIALSRNPDVSRRQDDNARNLAQWSKRAQDPFDQNYAYRHIATTYNMDRIISPAGSILNAGKMVNVNLADESMLHAAIRRALLENDPNTLRAERVAAQLAVNIVDLRDRDERVTVLSVGSEVFYGLEAQPFISEIAINISEANADVSANNHFAVELYNPFDTDIGLSDFRLELRDPNNIIVSTISLAGNVIADGSRFVITSGSGASSEFGAAGLMSIGGGREDPNLVLAAYVPVPDSDPPQYVLDERYDVYLMRRVLASELYLDKQQTDDAWFDWNASKNLTQSYARPDNDWNIVYQDFATANNTLGTANGLTGTRRNYNLASSLGDFICVGDIARALTVAPSTDPNDMIGIKLSAEPREEFVRLDLRNPTATDVFQYLTVIDPTDHGHPQYETRIKGRVNVNTAPWYVIAQLPWMPPAIAQAIVAYRDTIAGAFESTGELLHVPEMGYYADDPAQVSVDLDRFPDLTPGDGATSDFEERDVIFCRLSNLATVRSDVFTAYILVRIGTDGPQKRVVAILDRSQVTSTAGKVKILALHPVPDPR